MNKVIGSFFMVAIAASFAASTLPYTTNVVAKKSFLNQVWAISSLGGWEQRCNSCQCEYSDPS